MGLTNRQKQRDNREQSLLLDRLVAVYSKQIAREIRITMRKAAQYYNGQQVDIAGLYEAHQEKLLKIFNNMYRRTAGEFVERTQTQVKKSFGVYERKRFMLGPMTEIQAPILTETIMSNYLNKFMLERITQIEKTTERSIGQIVEAGINQGLSEREIGRLIYDVAPSKSASRAQTIARTETHGAANAAAQATAQAVGVEMQREWVSGSDERVRDDHRAANGQTVSMYQPFIVGGVQLNHPGDYQAGAPEQTINCRCSVVFIPYE